MREDNNEDQNKEMCSHLPQPPSVASCNLQDCPEWITGQWSEVSYFFVYYLLSLLNAQPIAMHGKATFKKPLNLNTNINIFLFIHLIGD